jgi:hypothetical protein
VFISSVVSKVLERIISDQVESYLSENNLLYTHLSGLRHTSLKPALLSVENWVPLKPVLGGVRDVAHIYYPPCADSIKRSLQFSCNFVGINASEGSLCFQIFILHNNSFHVFHYEILWSLTIQILIIYKE